MSAHDACPWSLLSAHDIYPAAVYFLSPEGRILVPYMDIGRAGGSFLPAPAFVVGEFYILH